MRNKKSAPYFAGVVAVFMVWRLAHEVAAGQWVWAVVIASAACDHGGRDCLLGSGSQKRQFLTYLYRSGPLAGSGGRHMLAT